MRKRVLTGLWVAALLASAPAANAQNIDLTGGNADQIWHGTQANANAGVWMDQGAVSAGDSRRDLIIGAPGGPGVVGRVHIINGGPSNSGDLSLSSANATFTGAAAGDLFGAQTAAGNILNTEGSIPRNLVIAAPMAMSGRGIVYVFASGAASAGAASATYRIIGAPGDQLGTALATADLNNDGYREIIMGAPGNARIWIINGGPGLTGTRDLSTTPALVLGGSPGSALGKVMAAADVTGDNITDLLVGAPEIGSVYLFRGSSGGTLTLDAHFDAVNAGDRVGESVRVGDIDSDGIRDVVIGAPGVDGPDGTRTDSGAVFILWGSAGLGTRNMNSADVSFYGAAANDRLGSFVTSGDVNRDAPDDLVMLSPGASAGAGQLIVYYGRSRTSIGVNLGDGRRMLDLSGGGESRRILGDPATGVIRSTQVFEVTGEGARDIIVGVPTGESGAGLIYFTTSPRLRLSDNSLIFRLEEGATSSLGVQVSNPSSIGVPWSTTSNRAWLSATAAGSSVVGVPGGLAVNASASGLVPGIYTGAVTVRSNSPHLEMSLPVNATLVVRKLAARFGDFNGDRISDLTVYRPSTGTWYTLFTGGSSFSQFNWGVAGDVPVPADYDGDRKLDVAMYRPSQGAWFVYYSASNSVGMGVWGMSTDKPVPADYDGDGKADFVVYRPQNGVWYMALSTGGFSNFQWGLPGDVPAPADYDGDGKTDIAIYRPSNGMWYVRTMTGGSMAVHWGMQNDVALPADYDGDGAADMAIYRPSTGVWWIRHSSNGATASYHWGMANDIPVPADFNGDGRTDIVAYRPSTGVWYVWFSLTSTQASYAWGMSGDVPVLKR